MAKKTIRMTTEEKKTLGDVFNDYLIDCNVRNLRPGTLKHYKDSFVQIFKIIPPGTPIAEITADRWDEYRLAMTLDENKNDMSVYTYSRDLKTVLLFAMKNGWLEAYTIELSKVDKTVIETYSDDDLFKLLKKPNIRKCGFAEYKNWVAVNLLLATGIRLNSAINIRISDVDLNNDLLSVRIVKNRKPLVVPISKDLHKVLKEYLGYRKAETESDYLLCNEFGAPLCRSTFYHGLFDYNKARGVEKTGIHRFRHTFAKKWVLSGGSVVSLQKILGHSSLAITENYINYMVSDVQKDIDNFSILRQFNTESIKMR